MAKTLAQVPRAPTATLDATGGIDERREISHPLAFALGALIVQFLLGTVVNLFVKIPSDHPGANPPESSGGVVTSVSWLGTLVQAMRLRDGGRIRAVGFALAMAADVALLHRTGIATPMSEL